MSDVDGSQSVDRIDLATEPEFSLGQLTVRPAELTVLMGRERRELQPRVMQVLVALAKARPGVVSRDRLVELCWDGRIVGDDALNRCVLALRHLAQEFDPHPFEIETVPRVGHRLVENRSTRSGEAQRDKPRRWRMLAVAAIVVLAVAASLLIWQRSTATPPATIAVLPFRDLSNGDPYFAEGVGEEILTQLVREPAFRVAGRASAARFDDKADPREVGRSLGVDYILEGSVRSDASRVRISASLVQARDGIQLWSETYDRRLEDVLDIQAAIGEAVAAELKQKLVFTPSSRRRGINGEAYALYLNARGLLRSANPQSGQEAVGLLQQAIRADPSFAPAWASLSEALLLDGRTKGADGLIGVWPRAHHAARRALQLDPDLVEAHAGLGQLLGSETPEAVSHLRRAASIDLRSAEGHLSRGIAHEISGEYPEAYAAFQRALEVDPLWPLSARALVNFTAVMGDRAAAEAVIKRAFRDDPLGQHFAMARVAWWLGDFSEAVRRWSIAAAAPETRWASASRLSIENTTYMLKLSDKLPSRPPLPVVGSGRFGAQVRAATVSAPSAAEWRNRNRSVAAALVNHDENIVAAKLMLAAGRSRELVETYDSSTGLLGLSRGGKPGVCQLDEAVIVALALRAEGRREEADALLRSADAVIRATYRRGRVPTWFDDDAAGIWAAQGKSGEAIKALDRAFRRGWVHSARTDLATIAKEPAFRLLRGDPRFRQLQSRYDVHWARERRETAQILGVQS